MHEQRDAGKDEKQAAAKLGVSVHTVRAWRFQGKGPAYARMGRRCIYFDADLDAFIEQCRIQPHNGNAA